MVSSAGIISMGAYLPGEEIPNGRKRVLATYLKNKTLFPKEYIDQIDERNQLPGHIETNYDGWERYPWFKTWLAKLPPKKRTDPFQGTKERRRVPMDPTSLRESIVPHPMLPSDAETLAGALAMINGKIDKDEIDLLIVASQVPDLREKARMPRWKSGDEWLEYLEMDTKRFKKASSRRYHSLSLSIC